MEEQDSYKVRLCIYIFMSQVYKDAFYLLVLSQIYNFKRET